MKINEEQIIEFSKKFNEIEKEISKNIIGQKHIIRNILIVIIAGGNVLLEGLPGLGKTQIVKTIGQVLDLNFSRIQFTPDLMPSDITGTDILIKNDVGNSEFKFQKGPIFSNIVLADEINRATPKTQSALLEAMQEKTVTIGRTTYSLPEPFFVLATQNPLELEGTYPLPEAQLDRFMFKLKVEFPKKEELYNIINITTGISTPTPKKLYNANDIIQMREVAKQVPIAEAVADYAVNLIFNTHPNHTESPELTKKYIQYGSSPRGAQTIITAARINSLLEGRYNVSFQDIKQIAIPSLAHRIFLNFEAISNDITSDIIISDLIK